MSDSRVERLAETYTPLFGNGENERMAIAADDLSRFEAAGLLVIDPDDEATKERLRILLGSWFRDEVPATRADYLAENIAIDILTVLGEKS